MVSHLAPSAPPACNTYRSVLTHAADLRGRDEQSRSYIRECGEIQ